MDNRETLKALVEADKKCCGYFQYQNHVAGDGNYNALGRALHAAMPALEALLAEPTVPVSEIEALADEMETSANQMSDEGSYGHESTYNLIADKLRSLINRSHK